VLKHTQSLFTEIFTYTYKVPYNYLKFDNLHYFIIHLTLTKAIHKNNNNEKYVH
jgi:hypothetical protein